MLLAYYTFLGVLGILIYLMVTDETFASYVYLFINLLILNTKMFFWRLYLHPNNLLTKWWFNYKLQKSLKKLERE